MYQGKNVKVHMEEVGAGMMGFKLKKVKEALEAFTQTKNVLEYSITRIYRDDTAMLLTIIYED
jgi:hypothetical protein